jgi:hypothetical protein
LHDHSLACGPIHFKERRFLPGLKSGVSAPRFL